MNTKHILKSGKAPKSRSMGPHVRQVIPSVVEDLDPFVFLDHFGPIEKKPGSNGVPPHPHAGIATITYLFSGSNRHQDSYGHEAVIHAGDLAWMRAGKGIVHAEGMNENRETPETVHGLQIWISLPAKDKFIEPDFFHYEKSALPEFVQDNVSVKVICGELFGHQSPVTSLSPAYIFEFKMPAGKSFQIPIESGNTCGIYLISGKLFSDGKEILPDMIAKYDQSAELVSVQSETDSHFILLGGKPLDEPIYAYASFVMNTEEQIRRVMSDYAHGKMGTVNA